MPDYKCIKCMKSDCENLASKGSLYCALHRAPLETHWDERLAQKLEKHVFESGASRSEIKPFYHLIPLVCLKRVAKVYQEGAEVYGMENWKKGLPPEDVFNHAIEHFWRWREGDRTEDNLAKVVWGCFALMWFEENKIALPSLESTPPAKDGPR